MQTLELLRNKNNESDKQDEENSGTHGRKSRRKIDLTREFQLLTVDLGRNIDLKHDDESLEVRRKQLKFLDVTPQELVEREVAAQHAAKVNLYCGLEPASGISSAPRKISRSTSSM